MFPRCLCISEQALLGRQAWQVSGTGCVCFQNFDPGLVNRCQVNDPIAWLGKTECKAMLAQRRGSVADRNSFGRNSKHVEAVYIFLRRHNSL